MEEPRKNVRLMNMAQAKGLNPNLIRIFRQKGMSVNYIGTNLDYNYTGLPKHGYHKYIGDYEYITLTNNELNQYEVNQILSECRVGFTCGEIITSKNYIKWWKVK